MAKALQVGCLFNIQRFSLHDGPGIRTTVFFKGCPLNCWWCHNPESIAPEPELVFQAHRCQGCGACLKACVEANHCRGRPGPVPLSHCTQDGVCERVCPSEAWQRFGRCWTEAAVMDEILRDRLFYEESGGGVTFSGGEPLMQPEFLLALLQRCRDQGVCTAVDTSGYAPWEVMLAVAEMTDWLLYDLKTINPDLHEQFTGVPHTLILSNLEALLHAGYPVEIRVPWIPGLNDAADDLTLLAEWLQERGCTAVTLLPYHRWGAHKAEMYARFNRTLPVVSPDEAAIGNQVALLEAFGLTVSREG